MQVPSPYIGSQCLEAALAKAIFRNALRCFYEQFFQRACHFLNIEFTRATATLVGNVAILPNNVHPVRHGIECAGDSVVDVIDEHWNRHIQVDRAGDSHFLAALEGLGLLNLQG